MAVAAKATTPEDVLKFSAPTEAANTYGIVFLGFKIRDVENKTDMFKVGCLASAAEREAAAKTTSQSAARSMHYAFSANFLRLKTIGTTLVFRVGDKPVKNFRMIERHYFQGKLVNSYDFNFVFCIPNSTNSWEAIYTLPKFSESEIAKMVAHPYETTSDSFYFVEDRLVMHNKAFYRYVA